MCLGKSFAVEWVGFARANSVSPGYVKTEITDFVPEEVKQLWNDKIPMGYVYISHIPPPPKKKKNSHSTVFFMLDFSLLSLATGTRS